MFLGLIGPVKFSAFKSSSFLRLFLCGVSSCFESCLLTLSMCFVFEFLPCRSSSSRSIMDAYQIPDHFSGHSFR
ncbi:Protein of unknown function [Pyronema omphalodes CBS 100304]|uniref:Uncharacterized protein n=1 Tax=Pyronema omphalodes (strain CBS 100304) TaxID=1076935 RepID=U4L8Y6_PYROM|nr:Protein of unknown function [Pyronema omphalodes CBS 100304]